MENSWGEGGRGRTGKDADVEDVYVKAHVEVIDLPLSSSVDVYIDRIGEKNYGWDGCNLPCASPQFLTKTFKKTIFIGGTNVTYSKK